AKSKRAYLLVTHDRRFLDRVAEEIVDLENGKLTAYSGGYSAYRRQKAERVLTATRAFDKQQEFIEKEKEYIRRNIAGQNSRQAKGRRTKLARVEVLEKPTEDTTQVAFRFDAAKVGGRIFLRAKDLDVGYEAGAPIVRGVSFELLRGERLAILGENGTGKTTLLKTLAGRLPALTGSAATGHEVSIGYYDQLLSDLDPARRAIDSIWDEHPEETEEAMRSYLALFDFRGDEVFARIGGLSGGEKGRLTLAVVMKQNHNLLLLDEPTNHLDLDSREALEEALEGFPGSILFVSHDRAFIDRLATRVLDLWGGRALPLPGNYTDTAAARAERRTKPAFEALVPKPAVRAAPAKATKEGRSPAEREATRRRKRVASLEARIAGLEKDVEALETRLYEEALTLGPVASTELARERREKKESLEALVEEWAALAGEDQETRRRGDGATA
ncbi:MAG: ABC-F family ATP-binding cassette domain-containing protein, partial [Thermoanaerobaculia bacterium]